MTAFWKRLARGLLALSPAALALAVLLAGSGVAVAGKPETAALSNAGTLAPLPFGPSTDPQLQTAALSQQGDADDIDAPLPVFGRLVRPQPFVLRTKGHDDVILPAVRHCRPPTTGPPRL
jgi:hypothetical protein